MKRSLQYYFIKALRVPVRNFRISLVSTLLILFPSLFFAQPTHTVFKETVGTYGGIISVASYNGWCNGTTYTHGCTGTSVVSNAISASSYSGASGGTPVRVPAIPNGPNPPTSTWTISGINTSSYSNITLSFGIHKTGSTASGSGMIIEVSSDGTNYTALTWTALPTGSGTGDTWHYRTGGTQVTGTIPSASNLRIRFRNTSSNTYDFDDIELRASFALPLRLLDFSAQRKNNATELLWLTTDEQNVNRFEIQRSEDGISFKTISEIKARNTGAQESYSAIDAQIVYSKVYYRLMSVDNDGKTSFSKVVSITDKNLLQTLSFANLASKKTILISAPDALAGNYQYAVYNLNGELIEDGQINLLPVVSNKLIITASAKPGVYILKVVNGNFQQQLRFITQ